MSSLIADVENRITTMGFTDSDSEAQALRLLGDRHDEESIEMDEK